MIILGYNVVGIIFPDAPEIKAQPEVEIVRGPVDEYNYFRDSSIFHDFKNHEFIYNKSGARIYHVLNWNTPDMYSVGEESAYWTGVSWDGNTFLGYPKGDYVYYVEEYTGSTREFKDSVITIERKFPKKGVTRDVRLTAWWQMTVGEFYSRDNFTIDEFLIEGLVLRNKGKKFPKYQEAIKEKIMNTEGTDLKEKIIAFTSETLGDSKNWDPWRWPGYYSN
ncbi:MAG TPA: hypothetical protein VFQ59_03520 [Candidatus Paceibacterota bacterium]|nr:hypothetical protein [Candidatus Paceibacterota bacterium]